MKYRSAPIMISGTVFVAEWELADALGLKDNDEKTAVEQLEDVHPDRINVAFRDLANDKLHELMPTDDPFKLNEIEF